MITVVLITKNDIIKEWNKMSEHFRMIPCCPECRDNLLNDITIGSKRTFVCHNIMCESTNVYVHYREKKIYEILSDKYFNKDEMIIKNRGE